MVEVRVQARYYKRMKPQRVYPLVVKLQTDAKLPPGAPVFVNPVIPGTLVTPSELTLDSAASTATFYVTPLAKGKLPSARLDIFHQGRLVQEMPLAMRSTTQRVTWVLALLTILIPAFLLHWTVYSPLKGGGYRTRLVPIDAPGKNAGQPKLQPEAIPQKPREVSKDIDEESADLAFEPEQDGTPTKQDEPKQGATGRGRSRGGVPEPEIAPTTREEIISYPLSPGETLEREINKFVPAVEIPRAEGEQPLGITKAIASGLGEVYQLLVASSDYHISFWIGLVFFILTVISAMTRCAARVRKRSAPLQLTRG